MILRTAVNEVIYKAGEAADHECWQTDEVVKHVQTCEHRCLR